MHSTEKSLKEYGDKVSGDRSQGHRGRDRLAEDRRRRSEDADDIQAKTQTLMQKCR
jgi:hypothetical protein